MAFTVTEASNKLRKGFYINLWSARRQSHRDCESKDQIF